MTLKEVLEFSFFNIGDFHLSLYHIIAAGIILTIARIVVGVIKRVAGRYFERKEVDPGRQYAFAQFVKYIIYTIAILLALEAMGISISILMGGAAALLVGIGLGLQQTFNDLISGLILLIEGSVEVDDIIVVDGIVGKVTDIGIRTSKVETRDQTSILIPNSKLVSEKAINWSHTSKPTRFSINIGVAYTSDVDLITSLLLKAVEKHSKVLSTPKPIVQFVDFGNSSLDFVLMFYSKEYFGIELVKSEVRYTIMRLFREHEVEIPFPQTDLWLRNPESLRS